LKGIAAGTCSFRFESSDLAEGIGMTKVSETMKKMRIETPKDLRGAANAAPMRNSAGIASPPARGCRS
jgi:hypothetical protein